MLIAVQFDSAQVRSRAVSVALAGFGYKQHTVLIRLTRRPKLRYTQMLVYNTTLLKKKQHLKIKLFKFPIFSAHKRNFFSILR